MKIPVFLSSPTNLNPEQSKARRIITNNLVGLHLEPRALGRSDYPKDFPLKEVYAIAKHCHGGIILGFEQFHATAGMWKRDTKEEEKINRKTPVSFPPPWNQLEGGILFGLRLPLLIFKEAHIQGGIFDEGTTEVFVHSMPPGRTSVKKDQELKEIFLKWHAEVSRHYFAD